MFLLLDFTSVCCVETCGDIPKRAQIPAQRAQIPANERTFESCNKSVKHLFTKRAFWGNEHLLDHWTKIVGPRLFVCHTHLCNHGRSRYCGFDIPNAISLEDRNCMPGCSKPSGQQKDLAATSSLTLCFLLHRPTPNQHTHTQILRADLTSSAVPSESTHIVSDLCCLVKRLPSVFEMVVYRLRN